MAKARVVEEAVVETTVETVNAVAMAVVMTIVKVDVQGSIDKEKRYRKDNKKPRNTSSEKKTGFVIRNKEINNKKAVH